MTDTRTPVAKGVAVLAAFRPEVLFAHDYETAVRLILEAVGWQPPPPKNRRVGNLVRDFLQKRGPLTYVQLQKATGLSVGAVANGLKACGAVVHHQTHKPVRRGKGSGKPTNWYAMPEVAP